MWSPEDQGVEVGIRDVGVDVVSQEVEEEGQAINGFLRLSLAPPLDGILGLTLEALERGQCCLELRVRVTCRLVVAKLVSATLQKSLAEV